MIRLTAENIEKSYDERLVLNGISCDFETENCVGISGNNGAGKSTLIKVLSTLLSADKGQVIYKDNEQIIPQNKIYKFMSIVAPYCSLYDNLTLQEHLKYLSNSKNIIIDNNYYFQILNLLGLTDCLTKRIGSLSSGILQKTKLCLAFALKPQILFLDEPFSNLDLAGKDSVIKIIKIVAEQSLIFIASNEKSDFDNCHSMIYL